MLNPDGSSEKDKNVKISQARWSQLNGFIAGVFSGVSKLAVRLQTAPPGVFSGPIDCAKKTFRNEGLIALYKGACAPLAGWMIMDSVMLGSLTVYRKFLCTHVFDPEMHSVYNQAVLKRGQSPSVPPLPLIGHVIAGNLAGLTVSFVACPIEHLKARMQVDYNSLKSQHMHGGLRKLIHKLIRNHGISSLFIGLNATLIQRSLFGVWWGTHDIIYKYLYYNTQMTPLFLNFWAGGLSGQVYWTVAYPFDVVKQRIMTDRLGDQKKYVRWHDAALSIWKERGWRGFWVGFSPCFVRAFPTNEAGLTAFTLAMQALS